MTPLPRSLLVPLALALAAGCANDHREATTTGHIHLSGDREPFTFSSWDVGRVEWAAPPADARAVPPDVSAVLPNGTVVPVRGLTLATATATPGLTVAPAKAIDDGHGDRYPRATPVTGGGFEFDFADDRLVRFVAAGYDNAGTPTEPVLQNHAAADLDPNGDVKRYTLPLNHDQCVHLFGGANGLETDLNLPPVIN